MTSQEAVQATVTQPGDSVAARILVADDEPGIRSFIGRALGAAGYATDFAATGAEALQRARASHYDLVILDLVMPDMAGQVILERLLAARPDQAVLVLSCLADVAAKVDCLERGAQDYLTKPFSLAELLARVRVRLRGWPADLAHDRGRGGHQGRGSHPGRRAPGRRHRHRPGPADQARVPAAPRAGGAPGPVRHEGAAAGDGLGVRLRPRLERRRRVRAAPAVQARLRPDQDGAR